MKTRLWMFVALLLTFAFTAAPNASADDALLKLTVHAGDYDRENSPVWVQFKEPLDVGDSSLVLVAEDGATIPAQQTMPATFDDRELLPTVYFVLPKLAKGESKTFTLTAVDKCDAPAFSWKDEEGLFTQLSYGDRPVLRYMYEALDDSTSENRERTYKVYHHAFDPEGDAIITKGPGGQFTHHRGLFYGFNRITYGDDVKVDTWHCTGDTHLSHDDILLESVGPVMGRHAVAIDWNGRGKETFAKETRFMTAYATKGGTLIEFASILTPTDGPVRLDGDPQHAGFQFRASNAVAEGDQNLTYYLRPDGKGKPGETRNWGGGKGPVNLPWNAMSFVIDGQRYTAVYLDQSHNPKEARYSERTYGRFGSYFEYDLTEDDPLVVSYRVWIQRGEMTQEQAQALSDDFEHEIEVDVAAP